MPEAFELTLMPNDKSVMALWRADGKPIGRVQMKPGDLEGYNDQIRASLRAINEYVQGNSKLSPELDPEFRTYKRRILELRQHGQELSDLLLGSHDAEHQKLSQRVRATRGGRLTVFVDDENVTVPVGFAYDGRLNDPDRTPEESTFRPSISDFEGFWLSKFPHITTWLNSYISADTTVRGETFRTLYAADRKLWEGAFQLAIENWPQFVETLTRVSQIDVGCKYGWDEATKAWKEISSVDSILLFFGHSNGTSIRLADQEKLSASLKNLFNKPVSPSSTLLIANTCLSLAGNRTRGTSIVSLSARTGFAGMVGTEAEISNDYALLCCSRLIDDLYHHRLPLGEAFERMQRDPDLFPLNLFYSCYGDRSFQLKDQSSNL